MEKYLFRGKRKDNGEFVEGYYSAELYSNSHYISAWYYGSYAELQKFEVIPETVGQYIVREDVNGKKAFEGDIVKRDGGLFVIRYYPPQMMYYFHGLHGRGGKNGFIMTDFRFEIVGNIYDNPELLEGEK